MSLKTSFCRQNKAFMHFHFQFFFQYNGQLFVCLYQGIYVLFFEIWVHSSACVLMWLKTEALHVLLLVTRASRVCHASNFASLLFINILITLICPQILLSTYMSFPIGMKTKPASASQAFLNPTGTDQLHNSIMSPTLPLWSKHELSRNQAPGELQSYDQSRTKSVRSWLLLSLLTWQGFLRGRIHSLSKPAALIPYFNSSSPSPLPRFFLLQSDIFFFF